MTPPILVSVKSQYIEDQSEPEDARFVYGYTITLSNEGEEAARLISRHWIITDADGAVQEVQGMGVIGQQPRIAPGDTYTYTSGVVLATETGTMSGSYQMLTDSGAAFDADIPEFLLIPPRALH